MQRLCRTAFAALSLVSFASVAFAADIPLKAPVAAPALPRASGYIEASSGASWLRDLVDDPAFFAPDTRFSGWPLAGAGRANWWATQNISVQVDAQAEGTRYDIPSALLFGPGSGHFSTLSYLAGGHANFRNSQMGLLGVFGAIGDASGNSTTQGVNNSGVRHGTLGFEGQYYLNALTLYGQGGYDSTFDMGNLAFVDKVDAWFVRGTGRYFIFPNFMIEGTGQYAAGSVEHTNFGTATPNTDFKTWLWRLKAEWKPGTLPFSLFATYQGNQTNYDRNLVFGTSSEHVTENRVMAGLRLYMGQNTLLANDRTGATLDIIDPLGSPTSPLMISATGQQLLGSDARLKRDIALLGRLDDGLGIYRFRYLWDDTVYVGVMAQEVALIHPKAVVHGFDGYLRVYYDRLGIPFMTLSEWNAKIEGGRYLQYVSRN